LVSHAVGSKQATQANFVFNQAVSLALWATLITALLGYGLANAFFTILAPDNATKALSLKYFYWFFPSLLIQFSMTAFAAGLRGSGVVKPVMLISMLGLLINIVLSPVLIEGWFLGTALGVQGAGLASSVAAILSFGLVLRYFKKNDGYLTLTQFSLKLDRPTIKKLLKIGLPSGGEFLLTFIYMSVIYWALSGFSAQAQGGFGIGVRIMQSLFLPVMAVAFSAPAIIGQNLGAGNIQRIVETYRITLLVTFICMICLMVICLTVPHLFISVFSDDPEVINVATDFLSLIAFNFIPAGFVFTASAVFQGLGNTLPSLYGSMTRMALFALPVVFLALSATLQIHYIWYFSVFSVYVQAAVCFLFLRKQLKLTTSEEQLVSA
jgi:putative MATE family efflux protein